MQILITGATGFIGRHLITELLQQGIKVIVASRNKTSAMAMLPSDVHCIDYESNDLRSAIGSVDAVVNLAGDSISGSRWSGKKKASVLNSRLNIAQRLLAVIKTTDNRDLIFIQASAIGYYGHREELNLHEESEAGTGFLSEVVQKWEGHMPEIKKHVKRAVTVRIGVVMGTEGGMLKEMLRQSKRGAAGIAGSGQQWLSWIHIYDMIHAIIYLIINKHASGIYNVVAPKPVQQKEFAALLARHTGRKLQFPVPAFMIRLILGEMGQELILNGQHVSSSKLIRQGFLFKYESLDQAMDHLI